jgi:hypothetical protein
VTDGAQQAEARRIAAKIAKLSELLQRKTWCALGIERFINPSLLDEADAQSGARSRFQNPSIDPVAREYKRGTSHSRFERDDSRGQ